MMESVVNFFMSNAYADPLAAAPSQGGGGLSFVMMFVIFFIFAYFVIWRPQSKRAKEQRNLLESITKGDEVVTAGGLLGSVSKITDQYIALALANNVEIVMQKSSIVGVLPKGTMKGLLN